MFIVYRITGIFEKVNAKENMYTMQEERRLSTQNGPSNNKKANVNKVMVQNSYCMNKR